MKRLFSGNAVRVLSLCCYPALFALFLLMVYEKQNLHIDEVSSYIGANNALNTAISLTPEWNHRYEDAALPWLRQMTVTEGHAFDYAQVFRIQEEDVHPPLYHVLLHTVCSFFPGTYSRFFAGALNILFILLTLYGLRCIAQILTGSETAVLLLSALYALNAGILSAATFFRMYVMAMCCITMFTLYLLRFLCEPAKKALAGLFLTAYAGAMTLYYTVFYVIAASVVCGVWLLCKRQYKTLGIFAGVMAGAAGLFFLSFPAALRQAGSSTRGAEVMENLGAWDAWLQRIRLCAGIVNDQLYGGWILLPLLATAAAVAYGIYRKQTADGAERIVWLAPAVGVTVYFLIVSVVSVYITPRYFYPVYALVITLVFCLSYRFVTRCMPYRAAAVLLCLMFAFTTAVHFRENIHYLYRSTRKITAFASAHRQSDCICISRHGYEMNQAFDAVRDYAAVSFFRAEDVLSAEGGRLLAQSAVLPDSGLAVCVDAALDRAEILQTLEQAYPQLVQAEEIGAYDGIYLLFLTEGEG